MIVRNFTLPLLLAAAGPLLAGPLDDDPRDPQDAARVQAVTAFPTDFSKPEAFEANPGGGGTVTLRSDELAFSQPSALLSFEQELDFRLGNGLFRKLWVASPSSTKASDGLGPLYNARACQRCHMHDGRGHPPLEGSEDRLGIVLKLSVPAQEAEATEVEIYLAGLGEAVERTRPDPHLGSQLQDKAIPGLTVEGRWHVTYEEIPVALSGGESASLRKPTYHIDGATPPDLLISPRSAPQMIGLGLIEAIPAQDILAGEDPGDADGDGISGRAQLTWSETHARVMLGRFGHKAGAATVRDQAAHALSTDIGISSPLLPAPAGDCTALQESCQSAPHGDGDARATEIDDTGLDLLTFYSKNLAVPARRKIDAPETLRGKQVFFETGCAACHTPKFVTQRRDGDPNGFQLIWPFTDLLLHDMGEGLADHRPEQRASGREWRTAPLWGIGLTAQVSGEASFLHDGRARSLLEAILWHGGEAEAAKARVATMLPADRAALLDYLESL